MAKFCSNCGAELNEEQDVCLRCGVRVKNGKTASDNLSEKSKMVAGLLALFFGQIGAHNFYLGYNGKGTAQLLLTVFGYLLSFFIIGIPMIIAAALWGFIEAIMIFAGSIDKDAKGNTLKS